MKLLPSACLLTLLLAALPALSSEAIAGSALEIASSQSQEASSGIQIVEEFIAAFNARDIDRVMTFFTADAVYHNMPGEPAQGIEAVRKLIESYANVASEIDWEILSIAQTGTTVLTERVDRFVFGDKKLALPVMGAFELRDGKIAAWRDYFDMATWTRQMQD